MEMDEENLEAMFRGRCTHEQKRQWEQAARLAKRSLSDWLRMIADEAAEQALNPKPVPVNQTITAPVISMTAEQLAAMLGVSQAEATEGVKNLVKRSQKKK